MPSRQITEEARRDLIIQLHTVTDALQQIRWSIPTSSHETLDYLIESEFQHLFRLTQQLRRINHEEWPYPRESQYRHYSPLAQIRNRTYDYEAYRNDPEHPPSDEEIEEASWSTSTPRQSNPPANSPDATEHQPQQ